MVVNECKNWVSSIICSNKCCKDLDGRTGCCDFYTDSLYGLPNSQDAFAMGLITLLLFLMIMLLFCSCLDSLEASASTRVCSCGRSQPDLDQIISSYAIVQRPVIVNTAQPEIILVEKENTFQADNLSVLREYRGSLGSHNARMLNLYGHDYINHFNSAPSAPPAYHN